MAERVGQAGLAFAVGKVKWLIGDVRAGEPRGTEDFVNAWDAEHHFLRRAEWALIVSKFADDEFRPCTIDTELRTMTLSDAAEIRPGGIMTDATNYSFADGTSPIAAGVAVFEIFIKTTPEKLLGQRRSRIVLRNPETRTREQTLLGDTLRRAT